VRRHWHDCANKCSRPRGERQERADGGVEKLFRLGRILPLEGRPIGKLPINTQIAAYGNVVKPEFGPEWQLRFQVKFLFPK
jgi:hypothetical protein